MQNRIRQRTTVTSANIFISNDKLKFSFKYGFNSLDMHKFHSEICNENQQLKQLNKIPLTEKYD